MRALLGRFRRTVNRSISEQLATLTSVGDGSTLSLDFTQMSSLDSRFTFTRSTTATLINSSGYVESIGAAASNDPTKARFDYSPTTLTPRGLLIEGSATNLIYWSESFDTTGAAINWNWSAVNVTRGTVTTTAPSGSSATVVKIQETTATGLHAPLIVYGSLTSSVYTVSLFAKAVERQYLSLFDNGGSSANAMFNLSGNGTVVSESTAGIATITPYPNGWYRITMRTPTLTNINLQFRLSTEGTTTSYEGTLNSGVYIWGAQLEAGSGASSYISTGASQVARAADSCSILLSSFGFSTTAGTLYADWFRKNGDSGSQSGGPWSTDYASTRWLAVQNAIASNTVSLASWSGSTNIANGSTRNKAAATYGEWTGSVSPTTFCVNNSAVTSANRDFNPSTATYLTIGAASSSAGSSPAYGVATRDWLNNSIRVIKYWPTVLPNATLQSLTA